MTLGVFYDGGLGVAKDTERAKQFYAQAIPGLKKLAEVGDPAAQVSFGMCYLKGEGVLASSEEAIQWLGKAAAQKNSFAINELKKLDTQAGTPTAAALNPAKTGNPDSAMTPFTNPRHMGGLLVALTGRRHILFDGGGTSEWQQKDGGPCQWQVVDGALVAGRQDLQTWDQFQDFEMHIEFACPQDTAHGDSGIFLQGRYEIQILESFRQHPPTQTTNGSIYGLKAPKANVSTGPDTWQTYDITFRAARFNADGSRKIESAYISVVHNGEAIHADAEIPQSSEEGDPETFGPGPIRLQGHGSPVRFRNITVTTAALLPDIAALQKGATSGNAMAQYTLGQCYDLGAGVTIDERKAYEWYEKSAVQGYAAAQMEVASCYFAPRLGMNKDRKKAMEWYEKAAAQGHAEGQYMLGACYHYGFDVEKDQAKAGEWLKKAAAQGKSGAKVLLEGQDFIEMRPMVAKSNPEKNENQAMAGKWISQPDGGVTTLASHGSQLTGTYIGGTAHKGLTGTIEGAVKNGAFSGVFHNHEGKINGQGRYNWRLTDTNTITGIWSSMDGRQKGPFTWHRAQ